MHILRHLTTVLLALAIVACGDATNNPANVGANNGTNNGGGANNGGKTDNPNVTNNDDANNDFVNNGDANNDVINNGANDPPPFWSCEDATPPTGLPTIDWEHGSNEVITLATPGHSAQDIMANDEGDPTVVGKFAYGTVSKDLEDESIEVWIDDCSGEYVRVGEAITDSDGRIALTVPLEMLPGIGRYAVYLRVMGDNSFTASTLRVLPAGTQLIVFDIDGTLTTDDLQIFQDVLSDFFAPILGGDYVPEAREAAGDIVSLRYSQGFVIVYLTGRPYVLTDITRGWLAELGLPPGSVHVTNSNTEVLPTEGSVGTFKLDYLNSLKDAGFILNGAYGNASTDIYAYDGAGVPHDRTWIAGPKGGDGGTVAVGDGYADHLPEAAAEDDAEQPFVR